MTEADEISTFVKLKNFQNSAGCGIDVEEICTITQFRITLTGENSSK